MLHIVFETWVRIRLRCMRNIEQRFASVTTYSYLSPALLVYSVTCLQG